MRGARPAWLAVMMCVGLVLLGAGPAASQGVEELYFKAWVALRAGQASTAEAILDALHRAHPGDPRPYMGLGDLYFLQRQYARSIQLYGKALALAPFDQRILVGLGKWAFFAGEKQQARRRLREALNRRPDDSEARAYLAYLGESVDWPRQVARAADAGRITRGDMAGLLAAHLGDLKGLKESPFTEVVTDISSHWARDAILAALRKGLMKARPDHTFGPLAPLTRAGLAEVLYNIFRSAGMRALDGLGGSRVTGIAREHRSLQAILFVVGRGLLKTRKEGKFLPLEPVSGIEAIASVERAKRLLLPTGLKRGQS